MMNYESIGHESLGLYVLAHMIKFPEYSFGLCEHLLVRSEDFATAAQQATYAALVSAGDKTDVYSLYRIAFEHLMASGAKPLTVKLESGKTRTLKTSDNFVDCFEDIARMRDYLDPWLRAFTRASAEDRFRRDMMAIMGNPTLDAFIRLCEIEKITDTHKKRLNEIDALYSNCGKPDDTVETGDAPETINPELLQVPGFIGALTDYTFRTAPRPNRILAFAGALSMMSYLAGRKFTDHRNTLPNLYLVALAGSGCGKDHPRKVNKKIGMTLKDHNGVCDQIASGQGLEDALLVNPSLLFQMDEFDTMLNQLKDKSSVSEGIMRYMLNFFSESGSCHAMRKKALTNDDRDSLALGVYKSVGGANIKYPSLTVFGTAVPGPFYKSLSERALINGLLARCLVFECGERGPRGTGDAREPIPDEIMQIASVLSSREDDKDWRENPNANIRVIEDGEGAAAALQEMFDDEDRRYKQCEHDKDEVGGAVWSRGVEIANKLALLYAISENTMMPKITPEGIRWGWKVFCHSAERMLWMARTYVSDSKEEELVQKVLNFIREFGRKGVSRGDVSRKKHISRKIMDEIEATLVDRGEIQATEGKGGSTIYCAIKRTN